MSDISLDEINEVEQILLPSGCSFDDERRGFISLDKSEDLVACAGSGKTTALIAKILLMGKNMPFENDKGICVLTHTNVAINEIKEKISKYNPAILDYKNNFFGTIQQFVDTYLCIPFFKKNYNKSPIIDNVMFSYEWEKQYKYLTRKTQYFCKFNSTCGYPESLKINYKTGKLSQSPIGEEINVTGIFVSNKIEIIDSLKAVRNQIISSGYLSFDDAYGMAFDYYQKFPYMFDLLALKYKYVFIDEMQDTNEYQSEILNLVFNNPNVILQRIGDPNQAIYDSDKNADSWHIKETALSFEKSLRFSESIAKAISPVRYNHNFELHGNSDIRDIAPKIILYKEGEEKDVINKFIDIINQNKETLHIEPKDCIKIVGWNCKEIPPSTRSNKNVNKDTIQKYCKYSKSIQNKKSNFKNISSYLEFAKQIKNNNLRFYRSIVLNIFVRFLSLSNKKIDEKNITSTNLCKFFDNDDSFKDSLTSFSISLAYGISIKEEIINYINNNLVVMFNINTPLNPKLFDFLNGTNINEICNVVLNSDEKLNCPGHVDNVPIILSSVHGVKSETHKATLYLETKYYENDLEKVLPFLLNERKKKLTPRDEYRLKVVYVGLSRASNLLCLAMRADVVSGLNIKKLSSLGWEVHFLNSS